MTMDRREALKRVAWMMGGTVSAAAMLAFDKSYAATPSASTKGKAAAVLSAAQLAVVSAVAEIMIPRTDTPGAVDVGVPAFIDLMLKDVYAQEDRERYLAGLKEFEAAAAATAAVSAATAVSVSATAPVSGAVLGPALVPAPAPGKGFVALDSAQQVALVRKFHDAAVIQERLGRKPHVPLQRPYILMTKELTLLGYFTSEVGATKVLQYVAIPGAYHGCIPLEQAGNGKTWAIQPGIGL